MVTFKDGLQIKNVFVSLMLPRQWFFDRRRKSLFSTMSISKTVQNQRRMLLITNVEGTFYTSDDSMHYCWFASLLAILYKKQMNYLLAWGSCVITVLRYFLQTTIRLFVDDQQQSKS